MRWILVLVLCLPVMGCKAFDWLLLSPEMEAAIKEGEEAKRELREAQRMLDLATTAEEKAAAKAALLAAADRADKAKLELEDALENGSPSRAEALAGLAGPWAPWLLTIIGGVASVYQGARAKNGRKATEAAFETVEELGNTTQGKELKQKMQKKFAKKGVTPYVDGLLRVLGFLAKSSSNTA